MSIGDFLGSKNDRLNQQLLFTAEIDKMTDVLRQTLLISKSRRGAICIRLFNAFVVFPLE